MISTFSRRENTIKMTADAELESLRMVHQTLIEAVKTAESAVNAQLAQRRFWLEEICSNLDEEGGLQTTSTWKRPMPVKMASAKKISAKTIALKRKKNSLESTETKTSKKPRKKKKDVEATEMKAKPRKIPTVKIKMRPLSVSSEVHPPSPDLEDTESHKDDDEESSVRSYQVVNASDQSSDCESTANSNPLDMMVRVPLVRNMF